jgi:hypothetical protein
MIGDNRLDMPETLAEAIGIILNFGLVYCSIEKDEHTMFNANKLAYLNNEVYDKLHCKTCGRILHNYMCEDCICEHTEREVKEYNNKE